LARRAAPEAFPYDDLICMARVLLFAQTTGYQTRGFEAAARALGVELIYATDRCHGLDDPWRDGAIAVRFEDPASAVRDVREAAGVRSIDGVLAVGDRPALLASNVAAALGLPWHRPSGVEAATSKLLTRGRLLAANLPVPWFVSLDLDDPLEAVADRIRFPCVVKPLALSASRGVIRADDPEALLAAIQRVRALLRSPEIRQQKNPAHDTLLIEGYIEGQELVLEGLMEHGVLRVLAIFEKPDPLDGPFFEETIYVTPPALSFDVQRAIAGTVAHAALALGLGHGPIHAECRVSDRGLYVLEVAPRPIGGLCARALRFGSGERQGLSLEELLLRHALGEALEGWGREAAASGVMMIPVPGRGRFRHADGEDEARAVPGIVDVRLTARPGQLLLPPPEGGSYPGFIFARGPGREGVVLALRAAHARLRFTLDPDLPLVPFPR
jgi:biotin carboxylase